MLYSIASDGRAVFYDTDTATLPEQTWRTFRQHKMRFDLVVLDHTYGPDQSGSDHMSAQEVIEQANRMRAEGAMSPRAAAFSRPISPMKVSRARRLGCVCSPTWIRSGIRWAGPNHRSALLGVNRIPLPCLIISGNGRAGGHITVGVR